MYSVRIDGFKTKEQAKEFYSWYEGQGEQDACVWLEEAKHQERIDVDSFLTDMSQSPEWEGKTLTFKVKPA